MAATNNPLSYDWRGERGFTLVETLVALTVLTLILTASLQIFGTGFRGIRLSSLDAAALDLAASQLAQAGHDAPLEAGERKGKTPDGFEWSLRVEPYLPQGLSESAPVNSLKAYWITADVNWQSSAFSWAQGVSLKTLKVRAAP
jgi:general secretion pathway protein I